MASTTHHFRNIETILFLWTFDNKSSDGVVGVFYCSRCQVNSLYTFSQLIDFRTGNAVWTREANVMAGIPILAASPFNTAFCPQVFISIFQLQHPLFCVWSIISIYTISNKDRNHYFYSMGLLKWQKKPQKVFFL